MDLLIMMTQNGELRKIQGIAGDVSLALTVPKEYAAALGIEKGDYVCVRKEGTRFTVEKV